MTTQNLTSPLRWTGSAIDDYLYKGIFGGLLNLSLHRYVSFCSRHSLHS